MKRRQNRRDAVFGRSYAFRCPAKKGRTRTPWKLWAPWKTSCSAASPAAGSDKIEDIYILSGEGGSPQRLTSDGDLVADAELRWSPDGRTVAYFGADKTVRLIPAAGGPSRVLTRIPLVDYFLGLSWSPDSSKLAYTTIQKAWVIPVSGGEPQEVRIGFDGRITHIDWSPDAQTFTFTGATGDEEEVWLMSDFLPPQNPPAGGSRRLNGSAISRSWALERPTACLR